MSFTSTPPDAAPRWRDVRIAALARGASVGGDLLAATALLLALQARGDGGFAVAAVLIAASAPLVLLAPLSGRLVDRVDSRPLLIVVGLAQAGCCAAMAWTRPTPVLVALVAVVAAGASVVQPTFAALLPEMVGRDHLPRAMATMQATTSVGTLAGPPVAGLLLGAYGLRVPLLVDGVTFVGISVAGALIATRRRPTTPVPATGEAATVPAGATWRLWRDPLLAPIVLMVGLVVAVVSGANVFEVFFVRDVLHASTAMYGVISAVWTGAMVVGSWLVARRRADDAGYALLAAGSLGWTSAVIGACGLVPDVGWLIALYALGGAGNGVLSSVGGVLLSRRAPSAVRGRAFGYYGAVSSAAGIGGFAAGGVLVERFASGPLLVVSGALGVLAVAGCLLPALRAVRRERARVMEMPTAATTA